MILTCISCVLITPLCILPCKSAIEKLICQNGQEMTDNQNYFCTFTLVTLSFAVSVGVNNIADIILVLGASANTIVGFCLPIIFYLKVDEI